MQLNTSQAEAAAHFRGPCMVLSGPGSGKTTVITERVATLLFTYKVPPESVLVVTFTRSGAEEMKKRFLKRIGADRTAVVFGTFHSVFYRMLRLSGEAGRVLTEGLREKVLSEVLSRISPDTTCDRELLCGLLNEISFIKNNRTDLSDYQPKNPRLPFSKIFRDYQKALRDRGALDFDDLLSETVRLLSTREDLLRYWREKFRFILIDEFQDVNRVQYDIVKMLAAPENNLFIVGDDDQSIYAFRGAEPKIMLGFPKDYPGAKRILLDTNYRSAPAVVAAAAALIGHNRDRFQKKLTAGVKREGKVEKRLFTDDGAECEAVLDTVLFRLSEGVLLHRQAVLVRTNGGSTTIVQKCIGKNVPFITRDRLQNLFMHYSLKPVYACLNWVLGNRTRANFLRFMNTPNRYIRREEIGESVDLLRMKAFYAQDPNRKWMAERIAFFAYQLDLLKQMQLPFSMIHYFRKGMGYDDHVRELCAGQNMDAEEVMKILDEAESTARPYRSIPEWYAYIARFTKELKARAEEQPDTENRLVISTLHAAKGLEYEDVYILDLNELILPHEKSVTKDQFEEERRMLYVGMTRARTNLTLCSVKERYGRTVSESRFLREIRL